MSSQEGDAPSIAERGLSASTLHWLGAIAGTLARVDTLAALAAVIQDVLARFSVFDYNGLLLRMPDTGELRFVSARGFTPEELAQSERTALERHPGWVYRNRRPLRIDDTDAVDAASPSRETPRRVRVRSRLWLPVLTQDDCVGAFGLASTRPHAFTDWDVHLLELVCNLTAVAYERILETTRREQAEYALKRARDDAEAANRAKSEFLATMSHEIRTPMNGVLGMASLLAETKLGSQQREMVSSIVTSGEALLALIEDILDLSRIEARRLLIVEDRYAIDDIVDGVLDLLGPRAQAKGLELGAVVGSEVPPVLLGDASRIRQVLVNLAGNAVKFTDVGEVLIEVGCVDDALEISVRDSGIGMSEDDQRRLFQQFSQVDAGPGRRFGGSGLGLAISRRLVELMGGTLGLESAEGVGSRFFARLPLREADGDDAAPAWPGRAAGLRVLVADPAEHARTVLLAALSGLRRPPSQVASEEALLREVRLGAARFDVAIVDRRLLGGEALRALAVQAAPRVIVTGALTDSHHDRAEDAGVEAFVPKPIKRRRLRDLLVAIAEGRRSSEPPATPPSPANSTDPRRILVVEDNEINARLALMMIEKLGFAADLARDGAEAVERARDGSYAIALMDCDMPGVDGYEATRRIRALEAAAGGARARLRIVAMTANAMVGERERCLAAGMDAYLTKPVKLGLLRAMLEAPSAVIAPPLPPTRGLGPEYDTLRSELGHAEALRFVRMWLRDVDARIAALEAGARAGDADALQHEVHDLKGQCSVFGLEAVCEACIAVERRLRAGDASRLVEGVEAIVATVRAVRPLLEAESATG